MNRNFNLYFLSSFKVLFMARNPLAQQPDSYTPMNQASYSLPGADFHSAPNGIPRLPAAPPGNPEQVDFLLVSLRDIYRINWAHNDRQLREERDINYRLQIANHELRIRVQDAEMRNYKAEQNFKRLQEDYAQLSMAFNSMEGTKNVCTKHNLPF